MPKNYTKFSPALQKEYPFLKTVAASESEVFCTICDGKFSIADGGRTRIKDHTNTKKHINGLKIVKSNQTMNTFLVSDPTKMVLQGKELAFAYHTGKHRISTRTADCTSKMINKCFDSKFSCGSTKSSKLVQNVRSKEN